MKFKCLHCDTISYITPNSLYDETEHMCVTCNDITTHIKYYESWTSPNGLWTISQNDYCTHGSMVSIDDGYNSYYAHRDPWNVIKYDYPEALPKYVKAQVRKIMKGITPIELKALRYAEEHGIIEYRVEADRYLFAISSWPQEHCSYQIIVDLTLPRPKELPRTVLSRYYKHKGVNYCV